MKNTNKNIHGFTTMEELKTACVTLGLVDDSGGLIQIPGFCYPDLGIRLKRNIMSSYVTNIVNANRCAYMLEEQIFGTRELYEASGHLSQFHDPAVKCSSCGERSRADHLVEDSIDVDCAGLTPEKIDELIKTNGIKCPKCKGELSDVRQRSLMVTMELAGKELFLAPETAQHIFLHFKNGLRKNGGKLPFSLHQMNTASRAEVTPDLKRRRQFVQMEEQLFYLASKDDTQVFHKNKIQQYWDFFTKELGISTNVLKKREHLPEERSHYSTATTDIEAYVGGKWLEIAGFAHRGQFDLSNMEKLSNKKLRIDDEIPNVIEPSVGLDRLMLAVIESSYRVEHMEDGKERIVMGLPVSIAPYLALVTCVRPKDESQSALANSIDLQLRKNFAIMFDESGGSIGKRYRRADQAGVPFAIVVDETSVEDGSVTVRFRDSMEQVRVQSGDLKSWLFNQLNNTNC